MKTQFTTLARSILPILLLLVLPTMTVFTQETENIMEPDGQIVKTQYTVLDKSSQRYRSFWDSKRGEISFKLVEIKNLTTDAFILGVEVNIHAQEREQVSSSIAIGSIGSIWGASSSATFRNLERSGHIFLDETDLETILDFLNNIIGAIGQQQDMFTVYSISIREQFEFGMMYDPDSMSETKWSFTFTADHSTYNLDYQDGISTLRDLARFRGYIRDNQPE